MNTDDPQLNEPPEVWPPAVPYEDTPAAARARSPHFGPTLWSVLDTIVIVSVWTVFVRLVLVPLELHDIFPRTFGRLVGMAEVIPMALVGVAAAYRWRALNVPYGLHIGLVAMLGALYRLCIIGVNFGPVMLRDPSVAIYLLRFIFLSGASVLLLMKVELIAVGVSLAARDRLRRVRTAAPIFVRSEDP